MLEIKQKFSQILLLEILYVLVHATQNQKKILFFPGLPCRLELSYCPRGDPKGIQVCNIVY